MRTAAGLALRARPGDWYPRRLRGGCRLARPREPDPDRIWREAEASIQAGRCRQALRGAAAAGIAPVTRRRKTGFSAAQVCQRPGPRRRSPGRARVTSTTTTLWRRRPGSWPGGSSVKITGSGRAEAAFRRAIELDPGLVKAHKELVYLFGMQLRRREVDAEFKALSRLTALSHHDLFTWGLTHFTVWGPDIADDLESFIKADPLTDTAGWRWPTCSWTHPKWRAGSSERSSPCRTPTSRQQPYASSSSSTTGALTRPWPCSRTHRRAIPSLPGSAAGSPSCAAIIAAAIHHFQDALSDEPYDRVSLSELGKALLLKGDKTAAEALPRPEPGGSMTCTT